MYSDEPVSAEQQQSWFSHLQGDPTRRYFVFLQDGRPIGTLYFTQITPHSCEWGCYIGEEDVWPGSGLLLELAALDYAFDVLSVDQLNADVLAFNTAPQKIHALFEYEMVGRRHNIVHRNGESFDAVQYRHTKANWLAQRGAVMLRLPGRIREAAALIRFEN